MLGRGHAGESLDDASKEVTAPAGVTVIPQLHRDFSRPFQQPHSPQTTKAGHATDEKQAHATGRAAPTTLSSPRQPDTLPAILHIPAAKSELHGA